MKFGIKIKDDYLNFPKKFEYTLRSLNSLIKSINFSKKKYPSLNHKMIIIDDNSKKENISKINQLLIIVILKLI
ncbi:MAG: hypothetical protein CM1200mP5_3060 [Candidatus Pelagibacterales bacterium]|nr:MAG: hypothetical protein CM1200mP5_3060 [Pelagibacterales bacterium]